MLHGLDDEVVVVRHVEDRTARARIRQLLQRVRADGTLQGKAFTTYFRKQNNRKFSTSSRKQTMREHHAPRPTTIHFSSQTA